MADVVAETPTRIGEHAATNVVMVPAAESEKKREPMGFWQWVGVVGVGSVMALLIGPKFVSQVMSDNTGSREFLQKQFETTNEISRDSATAMQTAADAMDDLGVTIKESVGDLIDKQEDVASDLLEQQRKLSADLAPLVRQVDRLADTIQEQQEAEQKPPTP